MRTRPERNGRLAMTPRDGHRKELVVKFSSRSGRFAALLVIAALTAIAGTGGASASSSRSTGAVTVYAAASLTDVFPAIDSSNTYSFAGSNALATQIT